MIIDWNALSDGFWISLISGSIALVTLATVGAVHL
jgi:hypothetical protein